MSCFRQFKGDAFRDAAQREGLAGSAQEPVRSHANFPLVIDRLCPLERPRLRIASPIVTSDVGTNGGSTTETLKRIGPTLIIASALGSTLGIVIAQFLDDLGDGVLAVILGGDAVLFNNRVEFTGATDMAYAGGFILCLLVGFSDLFTYPTARGHGVARLTLLWTLLQVLRQAFAQAAVLPFAADSQLALAYDTLETPPGLDVVIAAGGGIGLLLMALSAAAAFLVFTPHRRLISSGKKRFTMVLWIALVPAVVAAFAAIPFFIPDAGSGVVPTLPLTAVIFLATLAAAPGTTSVRGPEEHRDTAMPWGLAATLIVILLFEIFVLRGGVSLDPTQWG